MGVFRRRSEQEPANEPEQVVEFDPVAVLRPVGIDEGRIARSAERLSDRLNAGASLDILLPGPDGSEQPTNMSPDRVVAIAVPPQPAPSANRMARRRHVLELDAPPYRISGTAYMPAGADPARYARSAPQRWLALTNATVLSDSDEFGVEVLLVNLDHVHRI